MPAPNPQVPMAFSINGIGLNGPQSATRLQAASALVLASRWESSGVREVTIRGEGRAPESVKTFRLRRYGRDRTD